MTQFYAKIKYYNATASKSQTNNITAAPGWNMRQPTRQHASLPKKHDGMMTLEDHNTPTTTEKQTTRCSSIDIEDPSPIIP